MRLSRYVLLTGVITLCGACGQRDTAKTNWKDGRDALLAGNYADAAALLGRTAEQLPTVSEVHYIHGCSLLHLGEMTRAEDAFKQALSGRPGYAEAMVGLGQIEYHREHYDEAGRLYTQALDAKGDTPAVKAAALNGLAGIAKMRGNRTMYRLRLLEACAADPKDACTLYNLGVMYRDVYKNADLSIGFFNRYLRQGDVNATQREKARSAVAYMEKKAMLAQSKKKATEDSKALSEGTEALAAKAYGRAVGFFKKALKVNPDSFSAAWGLAMSLLRNGEKEAAFAAFKDAARINPAHLESHSRAATLAIQLKRYKDAEAVLDGALAREKIPTGIVKQLVSVYSITGRKDEARAYGKFYLSLLPEGEAGDKQFADWIKSL